MNKQYLISLHKKRSIIALVADVVMLACSIYSIFGGIVDFASKQITGELFRYFTILSGCYSAFVATMLIPFAINGCLRKRFSVPRWLVMVHYSSAICMMLVFVFAVFAISLFDPEMAFGGYNLFLHVICPILSQAAFFLVESGTDFSVKDSLICTIPVALYSLIYFYNVVIAKQWEDMYYLNTVIPFYVAIPLMYALTYLITYVLRRHNNAKNKRLKDQLLQTFDEDLDEVAVKIEVYGLGRFMGLHGESNSQSMNLDILTAVSDKYKIRLEDLTRTYSKGVIDGLRDPEKDKR